MKYLLLISLALFLSSSCKKGQSDINIVLTLSNTSYGGSLNGATVTVTKTLSGTNDQITVGTFTSNSIGQIIFSTKRDKFDYLTLTIDKANFFGIEEKIYLSELNVNNDNNFAFGLVGKSWAAIHLFSASSGNSVIIHKNAGKSGCAECCPSVDLTFYGPIDTTFYCINDANTTYSFEYFINGGTQAGQKSGITAFADSTEILLNF